MVAIFKFFFGTYDKDPHITMSYNNPEAISIEWVYPTLNQSLHNGSEVSQLALSLQGYQVLNYGVGYQLIALDTEATSNSDGYNSLMKSVLPHLRNDVIDKVLF